MASIDRLPCGRSVDPLVAQVADGAAPADPQHERSCPHCRAALAEIRAVWAPLQALAAEQVQAPRTVRALVMARIRNLPRNVWYAVVEGERGTTFTAARVIGKVVRLAADGIPAISLALGRGRTAPGTDIGVTGSHVVLDVHVVVRRGAHIPTVARELRDRIRIHLVDLVGLTPTEINIAVVDITAPIPSPLPKPSQHHARRAQWD